jgi:hypothetical protein
VDGTPVGCTHDTGTLIRTHAPGSVVTLTIVRHGKTGQVRLKTANVQGHSVVGVYVQESYRFPFPIKIKVGDIGGPSAGTMFALGIVDKLTPGNLTGGRFVAGTGVDLGRRRGVRDRRHPAEDGGRPRGRGDHLPHPGGQLLRHHRGGAGRAAPGQGGHAPPGHQRPGRPQGRPQRSRLLNAPALKARVLGAC